MKKYNKNGFSLIETVVALAIVAILTVLTVPSFLVSNINNRLLAETNQVSSIISFARSEAARRNSYVSVCASSNAATCDSGDLSQGIIIFSDPGLAGLSSGSQIIKIYDSWNIKDKGKITNIVNSEGSPVFSFNGFSSAVNYGSILVCSPGYNSYTLNISQIGSVNIITNTGDGGC